MSDKLRIYDRLFQFALRFGIVGGLVGIAAIIYVVLKLMTRLESMAPAEMRLLLDLLKNRFFR